jgi:hypothetical protein
MNGGHEVTRIGMPALRLGDGDNTVSRRTNLRQEAATVLSIIEELLLEWQAVFQSDMEQM